MPVSSSDCGSAGWNTSSENSDASKPGSRISACAVAIAQVNPCGYKCGADQPDFSRPKPDTRHLTPNFPSMEAYVADARLAQPDQGIAKKHARPTRQHNRYDRSRPSAASLVESGLARKTAWHVPEARRRAWPRTRAGLVVGESARAIEELLAGRPQAGRRRGDEIEPLAVGGRVPALVAAFWAVAGDRLVDVGVAEVDAFDFRLRQVRRART